MVPYLRSSRRAPVDLLGCLAVPDRRPHNPLYRPDARRAVSPVIYGAAELVALFVAVKRIPADLLRP